MKEITPDDSVAPVYLVPLTKEEKVEREQLAQEQTDRNAEVQAKVDARQSALAKLAKLGLTEEEVQSLIS